MFNKHFLKVYLHLIHCKHSYPAEMKYYLFIECQHNVQKILLFHQNYVSVAFEQLLQNQD